jgi:hypothetical protein
MLLSVCDMCVAFSSPECSKTGQKKQCWKVHVRLVWCGQINLPCGGGGGGDGLRRGENEGRDGVEEM